MMDSNRPQVCRLCLINSEDAVNIWVAFEGSLIASILAKHFWFEVNKNDGLTEWLCRMCWMQTKTFHEFYTKVERYQKHLLDSADKPAGDPDETGYGNETSFEPNFILLDCKTKLKLDTMDTQISEDDTLDYSDDNACEQNESEQISETDQPSVKKIDIENSNNLPENELHAAQIREIFTMKCEICSDDVLFESLSEVRSHYRMVHKMRGYLICCGRKFWDLSKIFEHIRYHKSSTDHRSKIEERNAQIREFFNMKCEICSDVEFETYLDANRHYRIVHKTKGYLMCCGKKHLRRNTVWNHVQTHINPNKFRCDQCGKNSGSKNSLEIHMANHAPLDSRAHKCSLCSNSFSKESILKYHVKTQHTAKTGEKFPCDKCEKNFSSKLLLARHTQNVHVCSLKHICETCARRFKTKQLLEKHIISQHLTTPLPKAQCDICGSWLKHGEALRKHKNRMHKHANADALNCTICNKLVKSKEALRSHMKHVHGDRRHKCTLCDKAFNTATTLKEHVAGHTGEYLYNCPYCEKRFNSNSNLYSHRKKMHLAEFTQDALKKRSTNG